MRPLASGILATAWLALACTWVACAGQEFTTGSAIEGDGAADSSPPADSASDDHATGSEPSPDGAAAADDAPANVMDATAPSSDGPVVASDGSMPVPPCPSGRGPSMVRVGGFCIDSTEVTNGQYNEFLLAGAPASGQPSECAWNTTYLPGGNWTFVPLQSALPIANVDWCDAYAFCAWAGKRLCGKVGGGAAAFSQFASPDNEHYAACSAMGTRIYPYGNTFDSAACNGVDHGGSRTLPAGSLPGCEGGVAGLFDMSGNVEEWQNACNGHTGAGDACLNGTGAFDYGTDPTGTRCDFADNDVRSGQFPDVGIRCCATP
jgi:formylglycine-generating enzyme required for sulfatase activity